MRRKIDDVFGNTLDVSRDKQELATLIYYPKERTGDGEEDGRKYG